MAYLGSGAMATGDSLLNQFLMYVLYMGDKTRPGLWANQWAELSNELNVSE